MTNLINDFIEIERKYIDTTDLFIKGSAYWEISSTIGVFSEYLEAPVGARRPNIYIILSSPPAGRRSVLMSHATKVHRKAWKNFVREEMREESIYPFISSKFFEEFSIEGIIDNINDSREANKYLDYNLLTTEFGAYVSRTQQSSYLMAQLSFLSKLYYGEPYTQSLSTRGKKTGRRYLPENIYFTLYAGTQKMSDNFDIRHIRQGFLRRCMIINAIDSDFTRYINYLSYMRYGLDEALDKLAVRISERMNELKCSDGEKTLIKFEEPVVREINRIDKKMQRYARANEDKAYFISQGEILTKLCALTALADTDNEKTSIGSISVTSGHLDYVMPFFRDVVDRTKKVIEEIILPKEREHLSTHDKRKERIKRLIRENKSWVSNITSILGTTKSNIKDLLNTLVSEKEVFALFVNNPNAKGRGRYRIFFTCDEEILLENLKKYESEDKKKDKIKVFEIEPGDFLTLFEKA